MENDIKQQKDYDIDDWISHFENKESKKDVDVKETKNIIKQLKRIKRTGDLINPEIYIYLNSIKKSFKYMFESFDFVLLKKEDYITIYNDIIYIDIYEDDFKNIVCGVGFGYESDHFIIANIVLLLNKIFNERINIIENTFMRGNFVGEFIWGKDEIKNYNNLIRGYKKITPYVVHNVVDNAGNIVKGNC